MSIGRGLVQKLPVDQKGSQLVARNSRQVAALCGLESLGHTRCHGFVGIAREGALQIHAELTEREGVTLRCEQVEEIDQAQLIVIACCQVELLQGSEDARMNVLDKAAVVCIAAALVYGSHLGLVHHTSVGRLPLEHGHPGVRGEQLVAKRGRAVRLDDGACGGVRLTGCGGKVELT